MLLQLLLIKNPKSQRVIIKFNELIFVPVHADLTFPTLNFILTIKRFYTYRNKLNVNPMKPHSNKTIFHRNVPILSTSLYRTRKSLTYIRKNVNCHATGMFVQYIPLNLCDRNENSIRQTYIYGAKWSVPLK